MSTEEEQKNAAQIETNVTMVTRICTELGLEYAYRSVGLPVTEISQAQMVKVYIPNAIYYVLCECDSRLDENCLCYSRIAYVLVHEENVSRYHYNEQHLRNYLLYEINKNKKM
jgi:hypothetical protein